MAERSHRRPLRLGALGLAAVALAACGSGACEGPDGADGETIGFQLPVGNETAAGPAEQQVFEALSESCASGQQALDQVWRQFESDQAVLVFQAAIKACEGNAEEAVAYQAAALDSDGGFARGTLECDLLQVVTGVVDQVDPESVECTGDGPGTSPPTTTISPPERIDPRVEVFEALETDGSSTTEPGATTTPGETTTTVESTTTTSPGDGSITSDTDVPAIG